MVTIVGKVFKEEEILGGASVQLFVRDIVNGISVWLDVVKTDTSGRYQVSFDSMLDVHQNFSDSAEVLVCAWDDDQTRVSTHEYLGTTVAQYDGEALIVKDINITASGTCDYVLLNNSIVIDEGDRVPYVPVFEAPTQMSKFHSEIVFPQNNVANVYVKSGADFIAPYDLVYSVPGEYAKEVRGENVSGLTFMGSVSISVNDVPSGSVIEFEDIEIDPGLAFFSVRNRGIVDDTLSISTFYSSKFTPSRVEFYLGDDLIREITDFSTPLVIIPVVHSDDISRNVKMVSYGTLEGSTEETEYIYEQAVKNFATITGDISISLDPDTGKHTAALSLDGSPSVSEILWQIVYRSTVVERIIKVTDEEQRALINIMYQNYADPSVREIEFEALRPGNYTVVAYAINTAGATFKISEDLFVPGGDGDEEEIQVGDSITIGCLSNHGEVPILSVYRLSREGYVDVISVPMEHAFDRTYFYDYTVEDPDSFYIFKASDSVVVKKVGSPRGCAVVYARDKATGRTIPYELQDFNGNIIDSGVLDDSGFGVYYKVMSENVHGVLVVGRTYKVV
jgi:hypothetical protein